MNYVVISPVKDEERNIAKTLRSVIDQTCKPLLWMIVDDGSSDKTPEIVESHARDHGFIRLFRTPRRSARQTGIAEVLAFNAGLAQVQNIEYDCIVKLDGDVSLEPDYFERLMARFEDNPRLGIASGVYLEDRGSGWREVRMPRYHAAGASKVVRRQCFCAIEGFIAQRGWDTVDEIRAIALGWETTHFTDLKFKHWKPEGTGMGVIKTCFMHGEIFYRTGGGIWFFVLKVFNRLRGAPVVMGGAAMAWGYFYACLKRLALLVTPYEAQCYRALLYSRLTGKPSKTSQDKRNVTGAN